jgi:hypothetical protein
MRLSKNAKLYWDNSDSYDDPNWQEVVNIQDLTISEAYDEANVTDRDSDGFTKIEPTLNSIELSFSIEINFYSRQFLNLYYVSRDPALLKVVDSDDDDEDQTGIMGWFKFVSFGRDQNLADSQKVNIVAKPCSAPIDEPLVYLPLRAGDVEEDEGEEE